MLCLLSTSLLKQDDVFSLLVSDFFLVLVLLIGTGELLSEKSKVVLHVIHELALLFDFDVKCSQMVELHEFFFKLALVLQWNR